MRIEELRVEPDFFKNRVIFIATLTAPSYEVEKLYSYTEKEAFLRLLNRSSFKPVRVIFNNPATIVFWEDGSKTVVKAQNKEKFDKEKGLAMAIAKKVMGNKGNYNEVFKRWCK